MEISVLSFPSKVCGGCFVTGSIAILAQGNAPYLNSRLSNNKGYHTAGRRDLMNVSGVILLNC